MQPATTWRVLDKRLLVTTQAQPGGDSICELEPRSKVDVVEQSVSRTGEVRACIIDPVWKGWITIRAAHGEPFCEALEGVEDAGTRGLRDAGAAADEGPLERLTMAELSDLQAECMADDVPIETDMVYWTEAEARVCFETGGATRPPPRVALVAEESAERVVPTQASEDASAAASSPGPVEMSERDLEARANGLWKKGMMVLLQSLSEDSSLNGRSGVVAGWEAARGRYEVRLANRVVRALPSHLAIHPLQRQREANDANRGDEVVFLSEDAKVRKLSKAMGRAP